MGIPQRALHTGLRAANLKQGAFSGSEQIQIGKCLFHGVLWYTVLYSQP